MNQVIEDEASVKLDDWVHEFFRKVPWNYMGEIVLVFDAPGRLAAIERRDIWTKNVFYQRFHELALKKGLEFDDEGVASNAYDEPNAGESPDRQHE